MKNIIELVLKNRLGLFFIVIFFISCTNNKLPKNVELVLKLAGNNAKELQIVIDYYQSEEDSLKLKAAYFLIGNMGNKWAYDHDAIGRSSKVIDLLDSIYSNTEIQKWNAWDKKTKKNVVDLSKFSVDNYLDSLRKEEIPLNMNSLPKIRDVDIISSEFLIENIELAFLVWREKPWTKHINFDQFCEYILPYRGADTHEPLHLWRKDLYKKYSWIDSLANGTDDPVKVCGLLNDSLGWFKYHTFFKKYPDLSLKELFKAKRGACYDQVNMVNYVMRSQGIPVASTTEFYGHTWSVVLDKNNKVKSFSGGKSNPGKNDNAWWKKPGRNYGSKRTKQQIITFKNTKLPLSDLTLENTPLSFRRPNLEDVTGISEAPIKDVELKITNINKQYKYIYLCKFDREVGWGSKWNAIEWSKIEGNKVTFSNMRVEKVYLPAYYENQEYIAAGLPFYLGVNGKIIELQPNKNENIKIYRKKRMGIKEARYARFMIGSKFQGSNDIKFNNYTDLYTIDSMPEKFETKNISIAKKFRFVRYKAGVWSGIAELMFLNSSEQPIMGKYISSSEVVKNKIKNAFDGNIRTNITNYNPSWIGMDLGKKTKISQIRYLFRNSFNSIEPGDTYELLYWNNKWESLGTTVAKEEYLIYDAPSNAVLWLRNLSRGKAELIFFMKNGKQIWG